MEKILIDTVVECTKPHPESLNYDHDSNINHAIIKDESCSNCDAVTICSDFARNKYAYKQAFLESITNNTQFEKPHLCDWCGYTLTKKNDANHFCRGCGRTVKIDGLDQTIIKEIHNYNPPPSVKSLLTSTPPQFHTIKRNLSVAEKDPVPEVLPTKIAPDKPQNGVNSHKKGTGDQLFQKILIAIQSNPLTYNEIIDAVPEFKAYKKPLNSLWSNVKKYGMHPKNELVEYTEDKPVKIRLKERINPT